MDSIIYLVGLVVVIMFVLSLLGLLLCGVGIFLAAAFINLAASHLYGQAYRVVAAEAGLGGHARGHRRVRSHVIRTACQRPLDGIAAGSSVGERQRPHIGAGAVGIGRGGIAGIDHRRAGRRAKILSGGIHE